MFSGIVEELGGVKKISRRGAATLLEVKAEKVSEDIKIGDSISVNGTCLTLVKNDAAGVLSFEVINQTLKATNLGSLSIGDKVNLERALVVGERIFGHFVSGHIDCLGVIRRKSYLQGNLFFDIAVPRQFMPFILDKGSVAVDGISLTVAGKKADIFSVYIIPHTLKNTTLGFKGPADKVNIECDILAKKEK